MGACGKFNRLAAGLFCHEQVAAEFRLQNRHWTLYISSSRCSCVYDCLVNDNLSGNKSSIDQPGGFFTV